VAVVLRRWSYHSTAQVLKGINLQGQVAIVTGGSTGIGAETVSALAGAGAHVVIGVRSTSKAENVVKMIKARFPEKDIKITLLPLDLADFRSICFFAKEFLKLNLPLHMLICNAGMMGVRGPTKDGIEMTFGTNHFGHFALVMLLLPKLRETGTKSNRPSRVVVVSSDSHKHPRHQRVDSQLLWTNSKEVEKLNTYELYSQSKLANVLFTNELHQRFGTEIDCYSLHPGSMVATDIARFTAAGVGLHLLRFWTRSVDQAAATSVYCATASSITGKGGTYFHGCKFKTASKAARNREAAKILWDESEGLYNRLLQTIQQ